MKNLKSWELLEYENFDNFSQNNNNLLNENFNFVGGK